MSKSDKCDDSISLEKITNNTSLRTAEGGRDCAEACAVVTPPYAHQKGVLPPQMGNRAAQGWPQALATHTMVTWMKNSFLLQKNEERQTLETCQLVLHSVAELVLYFSLDKVSWEGREEDNGRGRSHFGCFWFLTRTQVYTSAWGVEGATKSGSARFPLLIYHQPPQSTPALPRSVSLLFQGHARPFSAPCLSPEYGAWGAFPAGLPHPSPAPPQSGAVTPGPVPAHSLHWGSPDYSRTRGLFQTNPHDFTVNYNCKILFHMCLGRHSARLEVLKASLTSSLFSTSHYAAQVTGTQQIFNKIAVKIL